MSQTHLAWLMHRLPLATVKKATDAEGEDVMNSDLPTYDQFQLWLNDADPDRKRFFSFLQDLITQKIEAPEGRVPRESALPCMPPPQRYPDWAKALSRVLEQRVSISENRSPEEEAREATEREERRPTAGSDFAASDTAREALWVCMVAAEEALREVREILRQEPLLPKQIKAMERWERQAREWGFGDVAEAIRCQVEELRNDICDRKSQGTARKRTLMPYNRSAGRIVSYLERYDVEYAAFFAGCLLWYRGFSKVSDVDPPIPPDDPVTVYQCRKEWDNRKKLDDLNWAVRNRIKSYEKYLVGRLAKRAKTWPENTDMGDFLRRMGSHMEEVAGMKRQGRFME